MTITGAIIAGGQSRRMGGTEKTGLTLAGRPMIGHVVDRMKPQLPTLAINANGDPARFAYLGLPVICDAPANRAGPLAGLLTMLDHAAGQSGVTHLATVPGDCPFLPENLVARLAAAAVNEGSVAIATSLARVHPVVGLWPVSLRDRLREHLAQTQKLSILAFLERVNWSPVDFEPVEPGAIDPFFNVNTPADLDLARQAFGEGST